MKTFKIFIFVILLCSFNVNSVTTNVEPIKNNVAEILKTSPEKVILKKRRNGATSARVYFAELGEKKFTVKVFNKNCSLEKRKMEIENCKFAAQKSVAPKVIGNTPDNSLYVYEYIDGEIAKSKTWENEETIKALAIALKKLHSVKGNEPGKDISSRALKHFKSIIKKKIALPTDFEKQHKKFEEKLKKLDECKVPGFCHNDLNPANIIISSDNKVYFIDFSGAGNGNVFEDLGYVTLLNDIRDQNLEIFLKA
jgi:thiamine kinase-like enzyme